MADVLTREQIEEAFERLNAQLDRRNTRAEVYVVGVHEGAAARTAEDAGDIRFLATRLGLSSSREVLDVVLSFYPAERLMLESPAPFRIRNVFVPESYLSRA